MIGIQSAIGHVLVKVMVSSSCHGIVQNDAAGEGDHAYATSQYRSGVCTGQTDCPPGYIVRDTTLIRACANAQSAGLAKYNTSY